jgi:diguanylate cyclase (GGDEF)-like protein
MTLLQTRAGLGLGLVLLLALIAVDRHFMPPEYAQISNPVRVFVIIPAVLGALLLSYWQPAQRIIKAFTMVAALIAGLGSLSIGALAADLGTPYYFSGFMTITVYIYFFLGLGFYHAMATALTLLATFVGLSLALQGVTVDLMYNGLYILFTNIIGLFGAYSLERSRRRSFLEANLMERVAGQDKLTGLSNRRAFDKRFRTAWQKGSEEGARLGLLLIDVDHFKQYNDQYGHQAGDRALITVAKTVRGAIRRPTDMAARYGGEEFVVLLTGTTEQYAAKLAEHIRLGILGLGIPHRVDGRPAKLTVSIGVATTQPAADRRSSEGLIQMADEALYAAKAGGRNQVQIAAPDPDMQTGTFRVGAA